MTNLVQEKDQDQVAVGGNGFGPEVEALADLAHILPLARQRSYARGLAEQARQSGFRRVAAQVADAAGRAGLEMVRGWFVRKPKGKNVTEDPLDQWEPNKDARN